MTARQGDLGRERKRDTETGTEKTRKYNKRKICNNFKATDDI